MNSGSSQSLHNERRYLYGALTHEVIGAFFDVHNALRWGLLESVYAGALEIELRDRGIDFKREARLDVRYKDRIAGIYRADFLVAGCVVLELKASVLVGDPDRRQLLNYLRITNTRLGLLLHFGPEPKVHRLINSDARGSLR